jgi:hypothetical protein
MASRKKKVVLQNLFDEGLIEAVRSCWSNKMYFYPVIVKGLSPKVKIQYKENGSVRTGDMIYDQGDELYEKIRELYLHKYRQINK